MQDRHNWAAVVARASTPNKSGGNGPPSAGRGHRPSPAMRVTEKVTVSVWNQRTNPHGCVVLKCHSLMYVA